MSKKANNPMKASPMFVFGHDENGKPRGARFVFLANSFLNWLLPELPRDPDAQHALAFLMVTLTVGLNTWMAIKGNAMTARNLLDLGWQFEAPSSAEAIIAKQTWDLSPSAITGAPAT